jgi:hypothetical protein
MQAMKRRRLSADAWAAMVGTFEASDLSAEAFCQQQRVSLASLQRWRAKLGVVPARTPKPAMDALTNSEAAAFVDLGKLPMRSGQLEVRLDFGGGVVLQLSRS